jgi:hypothetical protein
MREDEDFWVLLEKEEGGRRTSEQWESRRLSYRSVPLVRPTFEAESGSFVPIVQCNSTLAC